jgi:hypothetical protein
MQKYGCEIICKNMDGLNFFHIRTKFKCNQNSSFFDSYLIRSDLKTKCFDVVKKFGFQNKIAFCFFCGLQRSCVVFLRKSSQSAGDCTRSTVLPQRFIIK